MATHPAVVTVAPRAPVEIHQRPTVAPAEGEVRIRVEWGCSTPLDSHQADGGLLVKHPQVLGDGLAGTVVEIGTGVTDLKLGDQVFGFTFHNDKEKAYQIYATVPRHLVGKLPANITPYAAVSLPNNIVTAFHTLTTDLGLDLPWPKPENYVPNKAASPIVIWGAASSVGQYALQLLKYYNYTNVIGVASAVHHDKLRSYGAKHLFDYHDQNVIESIKQLLESESEPSLVLDCIGSKVGSVEPCAQIATKPGSLVAILLPVIIKSTSSTDSSIIPEFSMEVHNQADWAPSVETRGVRTHFYEKNPFYKANLQPYIVPTLLAEGIIEPNSQYIISAPTLLERAEKALDKLRSGTVSGQRLVWRIWTEEEFPEYR